MTGYGERTAQETAAAMERTDEFASDPAAVVHRVVGWAADAHAAGRHERARYWTAVACRLVGGPAESGPESRVTLEQTRGAVLNGLVRFYYRLP